MTHELNLANEPFQLIKDGAKTIESRLFDEKRQKIKIGDHLAFTNRENPTEKIEVVVNDIYRFDDFKTMFETIGPKDFGEKSAQALINQIEQFYTQEQQKSYGVVGFRFSVTSH